MLPVYQLSIPTPYPVGPVNIYLIKSKPYTLVDVGPDTLRAKNGCVSCLARSWRCF